MLKHNNNYTQYFNNVINFATSDQVHNEKHDTSLISTLCPSGHLRVTWITESAEVQTDIDRSKGFPMFDYDNYCRDQFLHSALCKEQNNISPQIVVNTSNSAANCTNNSPYHSPNTLANYEKSEIYKTNNISALSTDNTNVVIIDLTQNSNSSDCDESLKTAKETADIAAISYNKPLGDEFWQHEFLGNSLTTIVIPETSSTDSKFMEFTLFGYSLSSLNWE
ncbi:MAG: hypothetical protein H6909_02570 [Rickettsiaceae bacterium]|nr:hypothetical protein [Rickettsiaceae bacterium]